jgi:hypothetical protein
MIIRLVLEDGFPENGPRIYDGYLNTCNDLKYFTLSFVIVVGKQFPGLLSFVLILVVFLPLQDLDDHCP